mmetsp:Transcript_30221/g.73502  ORF Transcript_30221/g.73502 Transcript_30221/m.73502 type:complete len:119 (-) Transcript_30221:1168-1524(-)
MNFQYMFLHRSYSLFRGHPKLVCNLLLLLLRSITRSITTTTTTNQDNHDSFELACMPLCIVVCRSHKNKNKQARRQPERPTTLTTIRPKLTNNHNANYSEPIPQPTHAGRPKGDCCCS